MTPAQMAYAQERDALLARITHALQADDRFVAAWLAGSFGRGEQTWLSDLDLHVVVTDAASVTLCATPWPTGARTIPERLALFQQFGTPGLIFENHRNNPIGGTFTNVTYQESSQNIDWMLIPLAQAYLEQPALLLFDRVGLAAPPPPPTETPADAIERASTLCGYFWIIACGSTRALLSGRLVHFHALLLDLEAYLRDVQAALNGEGGTFTKKTHLHLCYTQEDQIATLRRLCDEMERLMPQIVALGGYVPADPRAIVELRLALVSPA